MLGTSNLGSWNGRWTNLQESLGISRRNLQVSLGMSKDPWETNEKQGLQGSPGISHITVRSWSFGGGRSPNKKHIERERDEGVDFFVSTPPLQAMYYFWYWFYFVFFSRCLGIPRDLISRNHRESLGIPGDLISGDLRRSLGISSLSLGIYGDLRGSLGMSTDPWETMST